MFPDVDVSDFDHSDLFFVFFRAVHIDFASPRHHTAINSLASFSQILGISHEPEGTRIVVSRQVRIKNLLHLPSNKKERRKKNGKKKERAK